MERPGVRALGITPPSGPIPGGYPARMSASDQPLMRLWRYTARHRRTVIWATFLSTANKVFDVAPEILIGFAVDVVVRGNDSFVAEWLGLRFRLETDAHAAENLFGDKLKNLFRFRHATAEIGFRRHLLAGEDIDRQLAIGIHCPRDRQRK